MPTTCDIEAGGCAPLVAIDGLPALHVIHTNYTTLGGRVTCTLYPVRTYGTNSP